MSDLDTKPKAVSIAKSVDLRTLMSRCIWTYQTYGETAYILDYVKTESFLRNQGLRGYDVDAAIQIIETRFNRWINP